MPTSWKNVIFKFRLIFATNERRIVSGQGFHKVFWGSPLIHGNKRMGFHKTLYGRLFPSQFFARRSQKSNEIWKWLCFKKWAYFMRITQPNLMILVSFSSGEDALSNDVKIHHTFSSQGTENLPFRFFGTPGIKGEVQSRIIP